MAMIFSFFLKEKSENAIQIKKLQDEIENNKSYAEVFLHAHGWSISQLRYEHDVLKKERNAKEHTRKLVGEMGNIQ